MASAREPDLPDAQLVRRARRGEAAAFETLVRRHYRAAYVVALSALGQAMDAEDVCQDAFIRALQRLDDLRDPERFAAWLLRIVRNLAANYRSYRRVRATQPLEAVNAVSEANTAREAERSELRKDLLTAIGELSPTQREVILLHDLHGWKHREIADSLGISEGMSRQHLFNARHKLRERLGAGFLEEHTDD